MQESYRQKSSPLKLILAFVLILSGAASIFLFPRQISGFPISRSLWVIVEAVENFLLAALFLLHLLFAFRHHSRENLWLALATFSFGLQNGLRFYFSPAANSANSPLEFHLLSFGFGAFLLLLFIFAASLAEGRFLAIENRKKNSLLFFAGALILQAAAVAIFYFIKKYFLFQIEKFHLHQIVAAVGLLVSVLLIWKYARNYIRNGLFPDYWRSVAMLFFAVVFAIISFASARESTFFFSQLATVLGLLCLAWILFVENYKYLEEEQELRYRAEQKFVETERELAKWQRRLQLPGVGFCELERDGRFVFANETLAQWLGVRTENLIGGDFQKFLAPDSRQEFETIVLKNKPNFIRLDLKLKEKSRKTIPVKVIVSTADNGWLLAIVENEKELLQREELKTYTAKLEEEARARTQDLQQRQDELEKVRRFYETLLGGMRDIVLVVNRQGNCTYINPYGRDLLGYEAKQLTGKRLPNFFADVNKLHKNYGDAMRVELRDYEAPVKTRAGKTIAVSWNVRFLFDENKKNIGAMCVGRELAEAKALREQLELQQGTLKSLVAERTRELEKRAAELLEILSFDEKLSLESMPEKVLTEACQTIRRLGWGQVIFSLKSDSGHPFKIAAYAGISKNSIREFARKRPFLFQGAEIYLSKKNQLGESYLIKFKNKKAIAAFEVGESWADEMALISPVAIEGRIFGFLSAFQPKEKRIPNEQFVRTLEICARKAAVHYRNYKLLKSALERAKQTDKSSRFKTDFFHVMAHELRTPLNSIVSLTDVLLSELSGDLSPDQEKQLLIIRQNSDELLKLINNILDLARSDSGKLTLEEHYFSLENLLERILKSIRPLCGRKNLKLIVKHDQRTPKFLFSDEEKIERIITNLLSNAVKYTQRGKIIFDVNFNKNKKMLQIRVQDSGVGMSQSELKEIFAAYQRVDSFQRKKIKGTGLGLAITKRFLNLLNAKIDVDSKPGKGTTFQVQIPVRDFSEHFADRTAVGSSETPTKKRVGKKTRTDSRATVLMVDDNPDNQFAVESILSGRGYRTFFASNGKQGVKLAKKVNPDIILMDMLMPEMDGYQATKKIRSQKNMAKVPIIAITAKTAAEDKNRALKAGCNAYLSKPFSMERVIQTIEKWTGKANG
ncbi:MAG: response regulator [Calditrichaeota bacterium]|nr:response regulator [Calditrichota bacterium]